MSAESTARGDDELRVQSMFEAGPASPVLCDAKGRVDPDALCVRALSKYVCASIWGPRFAPQSGA